jgi:hypothetical protein
MNDETYQSDVHEWAVDCFGVEGATDRKERSMRFLEEAVELAQSCDLTLEEVAAVVQYVYRRPTGRPSQEVGGVMVTLAALCEGSLGVDMFLAATTELARCWQVIEKIRLKHQAKPKEIRGV